MTKFSIVLVGVALLTCARIDGQGQSKSIQGVWRIAEANISGPTPRTIVFAETRPNLTIFTAKHYSRVEVQADDPRPMLADPAKASADELRAVWGPFVAEAGTYEVTASEITMRPVAAKSPAAMVSGAFIVYAYKQDGNTLVLTQQKNQNGPFANPFSLKLVRVE